MENQNPSKYQVAGVSTIRLLNGSAVSTVEDDLVYYHGISTVSPNHSVDCKVTTCADCKGLEVRSNDYSLNCNVVAFDHRKESEVISLLSRLNSISSPYVVTPLACGRGLVKVKEYYFLALPKFSCTFTEYIKRGTIIDKKRFTEHFIQVIRNVIHGMMVLKEKGFCCYNLKGNDVLISIFENTIVAQIWNFEKENAEESSSQWIRLGYLIQSAAASQCLVTAEVKELCDKLINQGLQGLKVLKQSALLTPRQKFDNILALNLFISVNSTDNFASAKQENPDKVDAIDRLLSFIQDTTFNWCKCIPVWICTSRQHKKRTDPSGTEFVSWLRYILEHEYLYVPQQQATETAFEIQRFGTKPDLEAFVRALMDIMFLQAQNLAADLDLEY